MKVLEKNGQVIEGNFEEKEVKEAFWHTRDVYKRQVL